MWVPPFQIQLELLMYNEGNWRGTTDQSVPNQIKPFVNHQINFKKLKTTSIENHKNKNSKKSHNFFDLVQFLDLVIKIWIKSNKLHIIIIVIFIVVINHKY